MREAGVNRLLGSGGALARNPVLQHEVSIMRMKVKLNIGINMGINMGINIGMDEGMNIIMKIRL